MDPRLRAFFGEVVREVSPAVKEYVMFQVKEKTVQRRTALLAKSIESQRDLNAEFIAKLSPQRAPQSELVGKAVAVDMKAADGRATWALLHSRANFFPDQPTPDQQERMRSFITATVQAMSCQNCAYNGMTFIMAHPPDTSSRSALVRWMCQFHNNENMRLGKPLQNCG